MCRFSCPTTARRLSAIVSTWVRATGSFSAQCVARTELLEHSPSTLKGYDIIIGLPVLREPTLTGQSCYSCLGVAPVAPVFAACQVSEDFASPTLLLSIVQRSSSTDQLVMAAVMCLNRKRWIGTSRASSHVQKQESLWIWSDFPLAVPLWRNSWERVAELAAPFCPCRWQW